VKVFLSLAVVVSVALLAATSSSAATPMSNAKYLATLKAASHRLTVSETAAISSVHAFKSTSAQVRAKFAAWGNLEISTGKMFAAIDPPPKATRANDDLAHAEQVYGRQLVKIAAEIPKAKSKINGFLEDLKPPSGDSLVRTALTELGKVGFKVGR
jgi:hypothetical protein